MHSRRSNWIVYLIFGIVLTSAVTTVTLSRYMSNISGNGTVNIASLDTKVTVFTFTPATLNLPGTSEILNFDIVNYDDEQVSEVDQSYSITINTTGNLPFIYELQCVNTESNGIGINTTKSIVTPGTEINGGLIHHTTRTAHEYELTVTWPDDLNDMSLADELELIKVVINTEQVIN